jgi:hypothetical protein
MKKIIKTLPLLLLSFFLFADQKEILEQGLELHTESCLVCHIAPHDKTFYTKKNRKMTNASELKGQVSRCIGAFNLDWFPEEEDSVRFYLNHSFYKFPTTTIIKDSTVTLK